MFFCNIRNNKRVNPASDASTRLPCKRKPGPLPRDFVAQRPRFDSTPPHSPTSSNCPSPVPW